MSASCKLSFGVGFLLSSSPAGLLRLALEKILGDDSYPGFLAIPALNNPRAGFARCKENNHV